MKTRQVSKRFIYSCFEKGCLTNGEKHTRQCRKLLWVMVVFTVARVNLRVFKRGGRKQHKHVLFLLSRSLPLNHLEPQSSKTKLFLPTMPIGIVAFRERTFVETAVYGPISRGTPYANFCYPEVKFAIDFV